jgi:hypothetical protein
MKEVSDKSKVEYVRGFLGNDVANMVEEDLKRRRKIKK